VFAPEQARRPIFRNKTPRAKKMFQNLLGSLNGCRLLDRLAVVVKLRAG